MVAGDGHRWMTCWTCSASTWGERAVKACMRVALAMMPRVRRVPPEAWCRRVRAFLVNTGGLSAAGAHAGVDEGKRFIGGEGVDGDGAGEGFEHGQPELAAEMLGAAARLTECLLRRGTI